ncbi:hypothetical protein BS17DRAFT_715136, partial [Gyrodon lividus]
QGTLDEHVREVKPSKHVVPYSNQLFREAAVEWLICTNQPIQAMDHPSFKKMVNVASHATNRVIVPNRHTACCEIMDLFKKQMTHLREQLNVCLSSALGHLVLLMKIYLEQDGHWQCQPDL